jgi:dipeptidyl aminopeptidase/acylaminoacyl peptidase
VRFLDALQEAGLGAPLTLLPGAGHELRAPHHVWAMYRAIWEFFQQNPPL